MRLEPHEDPALMSLREIHRHHRRKARGSISTPGPFDAIYVPFSARTLAQQMPKNRLGKLASKRHTGIARSRRLAVKHRNRLQARRR